MQKIYKYFPCNYNNLFYFIFDNLIPKPLTITQTGHLSKKTLKPRYPRNPIFENQH